MATKRSASKKPAKKASAKKKAPAKRKAPAKKRAASKKKKAPAKGGGFTLGGAVRWMAAEVAVAALGVTAGSAIAGALLWNRAQEDVAYYLEHPPPPAISVIWSAPIEPQVGQRLGLGVLADDLVASGYARVDSLTPGGSGRGRFTLSPNGLDIWTASADLPGFSLPEGTTKIRVSDGYVSSVKGPGVLHPTPLASIGDHDTNRAPLSLDKVSPFVEDALLAMEDSRFRQHYGIDPVGLLRAVIANATGGDVQGGSTLTQQLAKNLFLSSDRTMKRKVRELFFAAALESNLSKDQLLSLYLSEVYLGQMGGLPIHGVEAASKAWFAKTPSELALHEAATIVGVVPSPNKYSPVRHSEASLERRNLVLRRMNDLGKISDSQYETARNQPFKLKGLEPSKVRRAPYAVDRAIEEAEDALGEGALSRGGFHVFTGIDPLVERAAEEAIRAGLKALEKDYSEAKGAQAALVAVSKKDGRIVALVGGRSYAESPFNRATDSYRQLGSVVKPITAMEAFDRGLLGPADKVLDKPMSRLIDGKAWTPQNHDGRYMGEVTVRQSIEQSRNIPAIHIAEKVGPYELQSTLRDAGLSRATHQPSAALGSFEGSPVEIAGAYTAFGSGTAWTPQLLTSIRTSSGTPVLLLDPRGTRIASPKAARQGTAVLQGVIARGTGRSAAKYGVRPPAGGKTGTTNDYRDAWFVGTTEDLAIAVWVGKDQGTLGLSGGRAALPIWARFVASTGSGTPPEQLPEGLVAVSMCAESTSRARKACPQTFQELVAEGEEPKGKCDLHGGPKVKVGAVRSADE